MTWRLSLIVSLFAAGALHAQSEAELKRHFEGKRVTLKIAMPGTEQGVDVYPGTDKPLDYPRYADRLKDHGTAIRAGETAMVTKIRVKSKHVEFQLDGGGYGTMSDETSTDVSLAPTPKSKREKNLEAMVEREKDPVKKREMNEELDDLRSAREREDARNEAEVADAEEQKKQNLRQRRIEGGSRFNVRYRDRLPDAALTPKGLEAALAEFVAFDESPSNTLADASGTGSDAAPPAGLPRKGMLAAEMERMLGAPVSSSERSEGTLKVVTRTYRSPSGVITGEFVEDVLVRYSVTSN